MQVLCFEQLLHPRTVGATQVSCARPENYDVLATEPGCNSLMRSKFNDVDR